MTLVDRLLLPAFSRKEMTNQQIYAAIRARARRSKLRLSRNWKATIRNTLQRHTAGHPKCTKRVLFLHVDHGIWRIK